MMEQKALLFNDTVMADRIIYSDDPAKMKRMGQKVKNFNHEIWNDH